MPSPLACIGLAVADLTELNGHLSATPAEVAGRVDGVESVRYTDASGARVVVVVDADGETVDLIPSYDARPGALLADLRPHGRVVSADVLGDDNELLTRLAADLEQHRHLDRPVSGPLRGAVVALGTEMVVHEDATAYAASDASRLGDGTTGQDDRRDDSQDDRRDDRPAPRFAAESLLSYGLFREGEAADSTAHLAGTVLAAETRTHTVTGQAFHIARLRTAGFQATACLPAAAHPTTPAPGNVVAGSCFLVLDVPTLFTVEPPRRRRRRR